MNTKRYWLAFAIVIAVVCGLRLGTYTNQHRVVSPRVALLQSQIKTAVHGDIVHTDEGNVYFVITKAVDGVSLNVRHCVDCSIYWFNAELLAERNAEIVHHGDERYAGYLDQFAQRDKQ